MPCLLAARVWNRLPSFVNFKCAFAYPMPSLTLGAPCAMQYSITIATTLECVWLEANALSDTMRCGTWFTAGRNRPGFALNASRLACSCPATRKKPDKPIEGQPMCTCPPLPGLLLP